jgi:hypothetical protein
MHSRSIGMVLVPGPGRVSRQRGSVYPCMIPQLVCTPASCHSYLAQTRVTFSIQSILHRSLLGLFLLLGRATLLFLAALDIKGLPCHTITGSVKQRVCHGLLPANRYGDFFIVFRKLPRLLLLSTIPGMTSYLCPPPGICWISKRTVT